MNMKLAIVASAALLLAACQTQANLARVNVTIAQANDDLKALCPTLQAIAALSGSVFGAKQQKAIDQASAALNVACAAPFADTASAAVVAAAAVAAARTAGVAPRI